MQTFPNRKSIHVAEKNKKELELGRITEDEAKYLAHITDMARQKYNSKITNKTIPAESKKAIVEKYWRSKSDNS